MIRPARTAVAAALIAIVGIAAFALGSGEPVATEREFSGATTFAVDTGSVDVHVHQTDGEPRMVARLLENRELNVAASGESASISIRGDLFRFSFRPAREQLDLYVRDGARVTIETGSGDVTVNEVARAALRISGGSADLEVIDASGVISTRTGSGDQLLQDVAGSLDLEAGSGDIELVRVSGVERISTSSGDVTARELLLASALEIQTGSGDVNLELENSESELVFSLQSGSGDIRINSLRVEEAIDHGSGSIALEISTGSGDQRVRTR